MDPLSDLLRGIRADGATIGESALRPPWAWRCDDRAPLTLITVARGEAVIVPSDGSELTLSGGDTALLRGPESFRLGDSAETIATSDVIGDIGDVERVDADGDTSIVVGVYRTTQTRQHRLLEALPPALVLREEVEDARWLDALREVLDCRGPASQAMIDRIVDWGLVCTLGCWFDRQGDDAPAWYLGASDPVVGPALRAMHRGHSDPWTVDTLAREAKVSRSHFAKRFREVMGQPPLSYLARWRMDLAQDLLADSELSIEQVAKAVGYTDPFAFSTAFKRHRRLAPREFRRRGEHERRDGTDRSGGGASNPVAEDASA